jgi:quinoprotein glucose dehydrogenase
MDQQGLDQRGPGAPARLGRTTLLAGLVALVAGSAALVSGLPGPDASGSPAATPARDAAPASGDWAAHGADAAHTQSSPLRQITRENVGRLQVAWTYHTGDARPGRSQIQCNPIVVRGVLYATSPQLKVFALDAATGAAKWTFDPFTAGADASGLGVNRGVVYWENEQGGEARILVGAGYTLFALDAATGQPIESFGRKGGVDLRAGLGDRAASLYVVANTPGTIYRNLLIQGTRVNEGPGPAAPGYVRAFDVRTGRIAWTFHTIPKPGERGHDTWPADAWTRVGGANSWSGVTVDTERGLVFLPTGSAAFDFWGGNRKGDNLYANSLLVLKADTGAYVWHYQFVRHDIWDRDLPQAPVLVTVRRDGRAIAAVAQATKTGRVYVFDRDTGAPLFPMEEQPVPPSDLEGEAAAASQPAPTSPPPFARQLFTEDLITDLSPEATASVRERWLAARRGSTWAPPSTEGTIIFPGFDGGAEWGGSAYDATSGLFYVNGNEMPWILRLVKLGKAEAGEPAGRRTYQAFCGTCHGENRQGEPGRNVPSLEGVESRLSRSAVAALIEHGRGQMPSFKVIPAEERAALIAFLFRDVQTRRPARTQNDPTDDVVYTHTGYNRFLDPEGYPAVKPPWGTLNAIDLNTGTIAWRVTLGEFPELTKRGIAPTGTENYGGPVVTASGLVFIAATKDAQIRAFDAATGRTLWAATLPAAGYATPAVYAVNGKQYVVIAAGGGRGGPSGDAYVAYALP